MSNSNTTINTASTTFLNKEYYDRKLLETAKTRLVHAQYGQKRSIPPHSGKRVEFRRYELFTPDADIGQCSETMSDCWSSSSSETNSMKDGSFPVTWRL